MNFSLRNYSYDTDETRRFDNWWIGRMELDTIYFCIQKNIFRKIIFEGESIDYRFKIIEVKSGNLMYFLHYFNTHIHRVFTILSSVFVHSGAMNFSI